MEELTSKEKELQRYKRYRDKDKQATAKRVAKSSTKRYITKLADIEELNEIQDWIQKRMQELKG